jgi:hypothetical protein
MNNAIIFITCYSFDVEIDSRVAFELRETKQINNLKKKSARALDYASIIEFKTILSYINLFTPPLLKANYFTYIFFYLRLNSIINLEQFKFNILLKHAVSTNLFA